ncbi:hypothetical protein BCR44DRAFT_52714 [Catenaria anguillulae PL171]|uniref:Uncharacterized protein n=1 Tax=Catenaria anguillulae PL171 TaxID=765915 RepID=A0A1Y2HQJ2_9FUNG|nr:hypothetical protein BCR44DRAFT_52714 [Catenaria anguillulae PL171]
MATGGYGPGHPAATDTQSPPGISAGYLQTLGAYAHSGITANLHGGGGGGGGGRGGRLVFPPTPRAFYATLGSASTPATSTTVNVDIDDTLALARHALADPSSSSWGYPRDERVLTNAVHTILDLDLDVNTNASSPDSDHVNMQPPDLGWRTSHGESSQMALESARLRERVLSARALSLHGSQFAHDGADDVGVGGPSAGEVSEEYDVLDDHEQETYIPEYLLRNAASASASASGRVGEGQGLDDEDGDGDELGPMDDSWEMVVRPFDSVRGPATPYDYHDHMF